MDDAFVMREDITSISQLEQIVNEEQNSTLPADGLQWKLWICPNGENGESYALIKLHHMLTDGLGCLVALGTT